MIRSFAVDGSLIEQNHFFIQSESLNLCGRRIRARSIIFIEGGKFKSQGAGWVSWFPRHV